MLQIPEPLESEEQRMLFEWAELQSGRYPELLRMYHTPNGGRRDKKEAAMLKAEGVKRGVPDIFLPAARGGYHGLYVELKRQRSGTLSPDQIDWIDYLNDEGYLAVSCHGWEAAASVILKYLRKGKLCNGQRNIR